MWQLVHKGDVIDKGMSDFAEEYIDFGEGHLLGEVAPPTVHPSMELWAHREFFGTTSYASWVGIAVFLTSFGVVINNTSPGGEQKVGTMMLAVGFLFLLWATVVFFRANWPIQHRPWMVSLLILMIILLCVIILAGVRIWIPLGNKSNPKPCRHKHK